MRGDLALSFIYFQDSTRTAIGYFTRATLCRTIQTLGKCTSSIAQCSSGWPILMFQKHVAIVGFINVAGIFIVGLLPWLVLLRPLSAGPSSAVRDEEPAHQSTEQHKGIHNKWISLTVSHFLLAIVIALLRPEASAGGDHHRSPGSQDYHTIWWKRYYCCTRTTILEDEPRAQKAEIRRKS